jgi:hypothetical protein
MCPRGWGLRSGCSWEISFTRIGASTFDELQKQPYLKCDIELQCGKSFLNTISPPQTAKASGPASSPKLVCTIQLNRTVLHTYWGVCTPVRGLQLLVVAIYRTMRLLGIAQPANKAKRLLGIITPAETIIKNKRLLGVTRLASNAVDHTTKPHTRAQGCRGPQGYAQAFQVRVSRNLNFKSITHRRATACWGGQQTTTFSC